jgi:hypothetical protein
VAELVFNLGEVDISDWQNHKTAGKSLTPYMMTVRSSFNQTSQKGQTFDKI